MATAVLARAVTARTVTLPRLEIVRAGRRASGAKLAAVAVAINPRRDPVPELSFGRPQAGQVHLWNDMICPSTPRIAASFRWQA